jgi:hypothetical protein
MPKIKNKFILKKKKKKKTKKEKVHIEKLTYIMFQI